MKDLFKIDGIITKSRTPLKLKDYLCKKYRILGGDIHLFKGQEEILNDFIFPKCRFGINIRISLIMYKEIYSVKVLISSKIRRFYFDFNDRVIDVKYFYKRYFMCFDKYIDIWFNYKKLEDSCTFESYGVQKNDLIIFIIY